MTNKKVGRNNWLSVDLEYIDFSFLKQYAKCTILIHHNYTNICFVTLSIQHKFIYLLGCCENILIKCNNVFYADNRNTIRFIGSFLLRLMHGNALTFDN